MSEPARKLDPDRVRTVLSRFLAPRLLREVLSEMSGPEEEAEREATPEDVERARAWARRESRRSR